MLMGACQNGVILNGLQKYFRDMKICRAGIRIPECHRTKLSPRHGCIGVNCIRNCCSVMLSYEYLLGYKLYSKNKMYKAKRCSRFCYRSTQAKRHSESVRKRESVCQKERDERSTIMKL